MLQPNLNGTEYSNLIYPRPLPGNQAVEGGAGVLTGAALLDRVENVGGRVKPAFVNVRIGDVIA